MKCTQRSPLATRSLPVPNSGLWRRADGRPTPGSDARPSLPLPARCPPPSPPRWRRGPLARGCWCPRLPPRLRCRLLARGCRRPPSPSRWCRGPLARACRCPPSPTCLRRAPCSREFRGAVGWVLVTFSTRRGLWSRRWRPLAWTRGRRTLRRARRWAGGEAAAQDDALRDCVWSVAGCLRQAKVDYVHRERHKCRKKKNPKRDKKKTFRCHRAAATCH